MLEWEDWCCPSSIDEEKLFPRFRQLISRRCPKLVGKLPSSLDFLIKLEIVECPKLSTPLPKCSSLLELNLEACNGRMLLGSNGLKNFTSLIKLQMQKISDLSHVGEGFVKGLIAREDLCMEDPKEVRWLRLEKVGRLKRIEVYGCDGNLEYLVIARCKKLENLSNELHSLTSLTEFKYLRLSKSCEH